MQMAEKMSYNAAQIMGLDCGSLAEGAPADIVIFDPEKTYKIDKTKFWSKSQNTPFDGREVTGEVVMTLVDGEVVYDRNNPEPKVLIPKMEREENILIPGSSLR